MILLYYIHILLPQPLTVITLFIAYFPSPLMPEGEATFTITGGGIDDVAWALYSMIAIV